MAYLVGQLVYRVLSVEAECAILLVQRALIQSRAELVGAGWIVRVRDQLHLLDGLLHLLVGLFQLKLVHVEVFALRACFCG